METRAANTAEAQVEAMKVAGMVGQRLLKAQLPKGEQASSDATMAA